MLGAFTHLGKCASARALRHEGENTKTGGSTPEGSVPLASIDMAPEELPSLSSWRWLT